MIHRPAAVVATLRGRWQSPGRKLLGGLFVLYVGLRIWWFVGLSPTDGLSPGTYRVARTIDGDTLLLANGIRVRLLGIDCPESVHPQRREEPWGAEATEFTADQIETQAGQVRLEFDRERFDDFGRTLAFVWIGDQLLNEELLRAGLARWEPRFSYSTRMKSRFRRAETEARSASLGVWSTHAQKDSEAEGSRVIPRPAATNNAPDD